MPNRRYIGNGAYEFEINENSFDLCNFTVAQVRDLVNGGKITSGPGTNPEWMPTTYELDHVVNQMQLAVNHGRFIDGGYWPNDMIKAVGRRAGALYNASALPMPFRNDSWLLLHSWDDATFARHSDILKDKHATCLYLINPLPDDDTEVCISFEVVAFEGIILDGEKSLSVGDRLYFDGPSSKGTSKYGVNVVPYANRFDNQPEVLAALRKGLGTNDFSAAAAANCLDPVMVILMLLNTRGVGSSTINAPDKVNKARLKRRNHPIPPYVKVDSVPYVTAIMAQRERAPRGPDQGGTHASPIVHLRRGHWRNLPSGKVSLIRDTLVGGSDNAREQYRRTHYEVKL